MPPPRARIRITRVHVSTLRGVGRMAADATAGIADLAYALHTHIARIPLRTAGPIVRGSVDGVTRVAYGSVRGVARFVGGGLDLLLRRLEHLVAASPEGQARVDRRREALLGVLNGVLGDYLARTRNPLAITMSLRKAGIPLLLTRSAVRTAVAAPRSHVMILLHGLCMNDLQFARPRPADDDRVSALALHAGASPLYLHYNSGLHISINGRALAELLQSVVELWPVPVERITLIGHSMGGLVARSAVHQAEVAALAWRSRLRTMVFIGSPHHGAPLERGGHWIDRVLQTTGYTAPFARLGQIRSEGVTDLRHGNLLDDDWRGRHRFRIAARTRRPVPLPVDVCCRAIAGTAADSTAINDRLKRGEATLRDCGRLPGDGLVPVASALGQHADDRLSLAFEPADVWLASRTGHLELLRSPAVHAQLRAWLADEGS